MGVKSSSTTAALLVRVAGRACALPLEPVLETSRPLPLQAVAGAPSFVSGVALMRGVPTPVLDLAALLGSGPQTPRRLVRLRVGQRCVALAVEEVLGVRTLDGERTGLPPLLQHVGGETLSSLETLDAELLWVLRECVTLPDSAWPAA